MRTKTFCLEIQIKENLEEEMKTVKNTKLAMSRVAMKPWLKLVKIAWCQESLHLTHRSFTKFICKIFLV